MKQMPGRVLLLRVRQPDLGCDAAHLGLVQLADREPGARELRLGQAVQEVALVLRRVQPLEQLEPVGPHVATLLPREGALAALGRPGGGSAAAGHFAHPRVVPRGDLFGAQAHGVVEEGLELDLGIAQHVGVGRAAGLVLAQELGEDAVLVLGREIDMLDLDADHVGHRGGIDEVDVRRAVFAVVVIFPVLHEDADHLVALLLEQPGGDRGVDTTAQSDHDTVLGYHPGIIPRRHSP